jgi:beta-N-acetylhexosaminidase
MNKQKIKVAILVIILMLVILTFTLVNYKSSNINNYINQIKKLNIESKIYEDKNNFLLLSPYNEKQLQNELQLIIKQKNEKLEKEKAENIQKFLDLNKILTKLLDYPKTDITHFNLEEQRIAIEILTKNLEEYKTKNPNKINPLWLKNDEEIKTIVKSLTIEELISQLLIVGIDGTMLKPDYSDQIKSFKAGGYILMGKNIDNQDQVTSLTTQLQQTNTSLPSLITTDQEGGVVNRIYWDKTSSVVNWTNYNKEELCTEAKNRASIMNLSGINNILAPVADLSNPSTFAFINNRTISSNQDNVSQKIKEYITCYNKYNSSTLKHFPGHGMVIDDSHKVIPQNNNIDFETWKITHGKPFIDNLNTDIILSAHIKINKIDSEVTSMSKFWLTDTLRQKYNYKGLIITDDMKQYNNISNEDMSQSAIKALEAGNDMLLYVPSFNTITDIKQSLIENYKNNRQIIEEKVIRILNFKKYL